MSRENCCMNYPWYCDACEEEWYDADRNVWLCPFDDAVSEIPVLEADLVHFNEEN